MRKGFSFDQKPERRYVVEGEGDTMRFEVARFDSTPTGPTRDERWVIDTAAVIRGEEVHTEGEVLRTEVVRVERGREETEETIRMVTAERSK